MEAEALAKRHSLMREAVAVGAEAGAFRTILTHFSQVCAAPRRAAPHVLR
jgi:ribonuclease Z